MNDRILVATTVPAIIRGLASVTAPLGRRRPGTLARETLAVHVGGGRGLGIHWIDSNYLHFHRGRDNNSLGLTFELDHHKR